MIFFDLVKFLLLCNLSSSLISQLIYPEHVLQVEGLQNLLSSLLMTLVSAKKPVQTIINVKGGWVVDRIAQNLSND
jgi:hypothetical protein